MINGSKLRDPRFWRRWRHAGATNVADRCDLEVFRSGGPIVGLDGPKRAVDVWVQDISERAQARLDWHYSGGVAQVLHLGDAASRDRVEQAIDLLGPPVRGRIMYRWQPGDGGLYRAGVTELPEGAIAAFAGDHGESVFMAAASD